MANQLGKRYVCAHCATQLLVVKPGPGALECHGEPMTIEAPKPLPAGAGPRRHRGTTMVVSDHRAVARTLRRQS